MTPFRPVARLPGTALALAFTATLGAQQPAPRPAPQPDAANLDVQKVKDNVYVVKGGGANTAVFLTSTGAVVADVKNPGWGPALLAKIKTFTDKPVTVVVNTHTHADHTGGNLDVPASVEIVSHENAKQQMARMEPFIGSQGRGLPTRTFTDRLTLGSGADRVELYYFGPGQTSGDIWVVFPAGGTVVTGDVFGLKNPTRIDTENGGSASRVAETIEKAVAGIRNVDTVVTGHGDVVPWRDLEEYARFNRLFLTDVRAALAQGKTPDDIAATWKVPQEYTGYTAAPARVKENAQKIAEDTRR
jgi:glyoxylase-like metal-dependent hydrolase (beta-lactamase superfamily II)